MEFGDKLETVGGHAFDGCISLRRITMPSVRAIQGGAFNECACLTDAEFSEGLEEIGVGVFNGCGSMRRIAIPLKDNMFEFNDYLHRYNQFDD